jgi:hypothetical protein
MSSCGDQSSQDRVQPGQQISRLGGPVGVRGIKLQTIYTNGVDLGGDYMKLVVRLDCIFIIESPISNNSKGQTSLQSIIQYFIRDGLDDQVH